MYIEEGTQVAKKLPEESLSKTETHTLADKLIIVVLAGLALAGGLSVLGLIFSGLLSLFHVAG